jgi:hypothetical protein
MFRTLEQMEQLLMEATTQDLIQNQRLLIVILRFPIQIASLMLF